MSTENIPPRPYDKIQILFEVDGARRTWWPTTVLKMTEAPPDSGVVDFDSVEFVAMHGHKATTQEVVFYGGKTVRCDDGETSWRSSTDAADAGDGDQDDASWEDQWNAKRRRRSRGEFNSHCRSRENGRTKTTVPLRDYPDVVAPSLTRTITDNSDMLHRISILEGRVEKALACDHKVVVDLVVTERRVVWKTRVLELLRRQTRPPSGAVSTPFNSLVQWGSLRVGDLMDYEVFKMVVDDVYKTCVVGVDQSGTRVPAVHFLPSLDALKKPAMNIAEAHVIFTTARGFFNWLGVVAEADLCAAVKKCQKNRGGESTRVLGGLKWDISSDPLQVFVGSSCAQRCVPMGEEDEAEGGMKASVVEFATEFWDDSNSMFAAEPVQTEARTGFVGNLENARTSDTLFSFSWRWKGVDNGRTYSAHARRADGVRLGEVQVRMPYVNFHGKDTCTKIDRLLPEKWLKKSL